jgi:hypothetical protein
MRGSLREREEQLTMAVSVVADDSGAVPLRRSPAGTTFQLEGGLQPGCAGIVKAGPDRTGTDRDRDVVA